MPLDVRTNALDDLLDAERHFRGQAENALRELQSVLTELATRIAGAQLEEARRTDPSAPESWEPERWRKFFRSLSVGPTTVGWSDNLPGELERLRSENQTLKHKLSSLTSMHANVSGNSNPAESVDQINTDPLPVPADPLAALPSTGTPTSEAIPAQGLTLAHVDLLRGLRSLRLPSLLPARFQNHFPKVGLNEADRERQERRKLYVLYLLSRGLDIRLEIDHLISRVEGIGSRTGALRRIYDSMVEKNLISCEILEMSAPNTSLAMLRLTQDGQLLCQILIWDVLETERERINRLHQGAHFHQHTLAVLIFAMHARLRSYQVSVLPDLSGVQTTAEPDVALSRSRPNGSSETIYVEVELSGKELDQKWRNLVQLQGRVALCARNPGRRARLVGDCKLKDLHGVATDLETLIACKVPEIDQDTPLWAEEW